MSVSGGIPFYNQPTPNLTFWAQQPWAQPQSMWPQVQMPQVPFSYVQNFQPPAISLTPPEPNFNAMMTSAGQAMQPMVPNLQKQAAQVAQNVQPMVSNLQKQANEIGQNLQQLPQQVAPKGQNSLIALKLFNAFISARVANTLYHAPMWATLPGELGLGLLASYFIKKIPQSQNPISQKLMMVSNKIMRGPEVSNSDQLNAEQKSKCLIPIAALISLFCGAVNIAIGGFGAMVAHKKETNGKLSWNEFKESIKTENIKNNPLLRNIKNGTLDDNFLLRQAKKISWLKDFLLRPSTVERITKLERMEERFNGRSKLWVFLFLLGLGIAGGTWEAVMTTFAARHQPKKLEQFTQNISQDISQMLHPQA